MNSYDIEHPLESLRYSKRVLKRAQYEAFDFTIDGGTVIVRNESHEHPEDHEYRVRFVHGKPVSCTCPADRHFVEVCKHRLAIVIRKPLLEAAREAERRAIEAGQPPGVSSSFDESSAPVTEADPLVEAENGRRDVNDEQRCDCRYLSGFPCWKCVEVGRESVP